MMALTKDDIDERYGVSLPGETVGEWTRRIGKSLADFSVEELAVITSTPLSYRCVDCGVDTFPGNNGRKQLEDIQAGRNTQLTYCSKSEVYTVREEVWDKAGSPSGCLCVGCLEQRIGRLLNATDFCDQDGFARLPCTKRLRKRRERFEMPEPEKASWLDSISEAR
jgi:DNA-directed RNA polymerase subunit RPC12/RpoP